MNVILNGKKIFLEKKLSLNDFLIMHNLKENNIEGVHIYPLGGIRKSSDWANAIIDKKIKLTPTGFSVYY